MYRFSLTPQILRDVEWLRDANVRLGRRGVVPRRWAGRLRRELEAGAIAASSRMEGVPVDADIARRVLAHDRPPSVSTSDAALVAGYRDALAHAVAESDRAAFSWTPQLVLEVHRLAMGASEGARAGSFREHPVHVVDAGGALVYTAPVAAHVPGLVADMCTWVNGAAGGAAPVTAALVHARIAGIHPFSDGNGRCARILATLAMWQGGYTLPEFTSLEEWWGEHPRSYYRAFQSLGDRWNAGTDVTRFVATHVRAQRRQVASLAERLAVDRHVWTALEDIAGDDADLPPRAAEALFDAFHGRVVTNRYYRNVTGVSVATATKDLAALEQTRLVVSSGNGRSRSYTGSFRLIALVAGAAKAPVLASATASLDEQREAVLGDLREQVRRQ